MVLLIQSRSRIYLWSKVEVSVELRIKLMRYVATTDTPFLSDECPNMDIFHSEITQLMQPCKYIYQKFGSGALCVSILGYPKTDYKTNYFFITRSFHSNLFEVALNGSSHNSSFPNCY